MERRGEKRREAYCKLTFGLDTRIKNFYETGGLCINSEEITNIWLGCER